MNKNAQLIYGKVIYIYETLLPEEELSTIFSPATFWVDVTGQDCEVGYIADFKAGVGLVLTPPQTDLQQSIRKAVHAAAARRTVV